MSLFPDVDALRASLQGIGMDALAGRVAATARPVVAFVRRQERDDALPRGCSKIGGLPDLPEGFDWPQRSAYADAPGRVARLRKTIAEAEDPRARGSDIYPAEMIGMLVQMIRGEGEFAGHFDEEARAQLQQTLDEMRGSDDDPERARIKKNNSASRIAWLHACIEAVQSPFPLVFAAQLDLAALSAQPGFDPLLPRSGVLGLFADMTDDSGVSSGHRVFWHDTPAGTLAPRQPPERLRQWHDTWDEYGWPREEDSRWDRLQQAERLYPHSGICVPEHWRTEFERGGMDWEAIARWYGRDDPHALVPRQDENDAAPGGDFGDRLGGWPVDIQDHVENELAEHDGERIAAPGRTPWRQLFSYGGEYYAGTRRMAQGLSGDGQQYLMIREEDLAARRFDRVRDVYQCT